jgi:hypothetical protein
MPDKCYLFGCKFSRKNGSANQKISFHDFPNRDESPKILKLWIFGEKENIFGLWNTAMSLKKYTERGFEDIAILEGKINSKS